MATDPLNRDLLHTLGMTDLEMTGEMSQGMMCKSQMSWLLLVCYEM